MFIVTTHRMKSLEAALSAFVPCPHATMACHPSMRPPQSRNLKCGTCCIGSIPRYPLPLPPPPPIFPSHLLFPSHLPPLTFPSHLTPPLPLPPPGTEMDERGCCRWLRQGRLQHCQPPHTGRPRGVTIRANIRPRGVTFRVNVRPGG